MYDPLLTITTYIHNVDFLMQNSVSKNEFRTLSYSSWAAKELTIRIMDFPTKDVDAVIESFIMEMVYFKNIADCPSSKIIFYTAVKAAEEIYELIKMSKGV